MHQDRHYATRNRSHGPLTAALVVLLGLASTSPVIAQQPQIVPAPKLDGSAPLSDPYLWHVRGLPPGAQLYVHTGAGPTFRVIHALQEGTLIERLSCKESRGGYWCRVATVTRPRISGWVDGRFLLEETGFAPPEEERNAPTDPVIVIDPFEKPRRP